MTDRPATLLDPVAVRRRRQDMNLTSRALAKRLGISDMTLRGIESGSNHHDLPLSLIVALADNLATSIDSLLAEPPGTGEPSEADDAAKLGSALAATEVLTPLAAIADAFGWTLQWAHAAAAGLAKALDGTGLRLQIISSTVGLRRTHDVLKPPELRDVLRIHLAREGLSIIEARVLRAVLDGKARYLRTNPELVAMSTLRNAELIVWDAPEEKGKGRPAELHPDVAASLGIGRRVAP